MPLNYSLPVSETNSVLSHLEQLLKLPNVMSRGDTQKVKTVKTHTRGLQELGVNAESYGSF